MVVQLSNKCYTNSNFEKAGMRHVEHFYLDGTCPSPSFRGQYDMVDKMEKLNDDDDMVVHYKTGLSRTSTCIGGTS